MFFLIRFESIFTLNLIPFVSIYSDRNFVELHPTTHRVNTNPRQLLLLEEVRTRQSTTVEHLADTLGVTLQTVRRDVQRLAEAGLLVRFHGGVRVPSSTVENLAHPQREMLHAEGKTRIARAVAEQVPHGCSLILNIGTTTEAVARALLNHRNLTVVTNNMNVANILIGNDSCEVIVAGGRVRRSDGGLVGDLTSELLTNFKVDFAVIGCSAMDADGDVLDFDMAEVRVSRTILRQARARLLVTDLSKLDRTAPVRVVSLADLDTVVTDAPLPGALRDSCAQWGTGCVGATD